MAKQAQPSQPAQSVQASGPTLKSLSDELRLVDEQISSLHKRQDHIVHFIYWLIGALGAMFTISAGVAGLFISFQYFAQRDRLDNVVDSSERRVQELLSRSELEMKNNSDKVEKLVSSKEVISIDADNGIDGTKNIYGDAILGADKTPTGQVYYSLKVIFYVRYKFTGSSTNELISVKTRYDDKFLNILYDGIDNYSIRGSRQGDMNSLTPQEMVPGQFYSAVTDISRSSTDCGFLSHLADRMSDASDLGSLTLSPIFKVANQPAWEKEFKVKVTKTGVFTSCSDFVNLPQTPVSNSTPSISPKPD